MGEVYEVRLVEVELVGRREEKKKLEIRQQKGSCW